MERANAYDAQLLSFMGGSKAGDSATRHGYNIATNFMPFYSVQNGKWFTKVTVFGQ